MEKKIPKWKEWEEKPFVFGLYRHKKNGKTAIARKPKDNNNDWEIDKGKKQAHPLFRITQDIVETGTGNYFFNRSLKKL